jgi:hypothetical protein
MRDDHAKRLTNRAATAFNISRRIATAVRGCLVRGEITQQRHDEIMDYVLAMAREHPDDAPEVPADIRHEFDSPREIFWRPGMPRSTKKIRNTY